MSNIELWKERHARAAEGYWRERERMDEREALYAGERFIAGPSGGRAAKSASHVRNIAAELVEAQVDGRVPRPAVLPRREKDTFLAALIEDMLRGELLRLDFLTLNDMQERTVLIQGAAFFIVEWDISCRCHGAKGELCVRGAHPRHILPQEGVTGPAEEMDWLFYSVPLTCNALARKYGKRVGESGGMTEQIFAYYRNPRGHIGLFSWAEDTPLIDLPDYQAGLRGDGSAPEHETVPEDFTRLDGSILKAGTKLPVYRPGVYPFVMRKNVSVHGKFLGDSDVDKISDQQNTLKKLSTKIGEKLLKGGSYVTLPAGVSIDKHDGELKVIGLDNPAQKQLIDVINVQPNILGDLRYYQHVYEEARQVIGLTDSFMGRRDPTAVSGIAKEFAAAQSAGRLQSKRVMKNAAYARLFETMFRFKLAYAREPRPVATLRPGAAPVYRPFNRYDFLEQTPDGQWYWNDAFLFSAEAGDGS
jgi:hypothetical protein